MKKLLDSDWLGAVQVKRNTSLKSVTPMQITNRNFLKANRKFSEPMISHKMTTKI